MSRATSKGAASLRREGHPKVLLEAMAAGLPCVAWEGPGNRALVRDEETGLLFDARDPATLAARLARVLTDEPLAAALGRRGDDLVARDYDLARLVRTEIDRPQRVAQEPRRLDVGSARAPTSP